MNNAENYFSIFKHGINGIYHHISHEHAPLYLAEVDFRCSSFRHNLLPQPRRRLRNESRTSAESQAATLFRLRPRATMTPPARSGSPAID